MACDRSPYRRPRCCIEQLIPQQPSLPVRRVFRYLRVSHKLAKHSLRL